MNGKNIVLLHGWGASTAKLEPLEKQLKKLRWNTLNMGLPGFDLADPKKPWSVNDYVGYVRNTARNEFSDYYVFGHSFGGRVAIKLASQEHISGIILCASAGVSRGKPVKRIIFFVLAKAGKVLNIIPSLAKVWQKTLYKLAGERDYQKTNGVMRETIKRVIKEDLKPFLKLIDMPVLILWGKDDKTTPEKDAKLLHSKIKNSKIILFGNQGHKLPYNEPGKLALEIEKWHKQIH